MTNVYAKDVAPLQDIHTWYNGVVKILFLAAEVAPFVKIGGLSQVMYFLPRAHNKNGHDARIFMPKYAQIDSPHEKKT